MHRELLALCLHKWKKEMCGQVSVSRSYTGVDFSLLEHLFCKWGEVDLVRILESTNSLEDQLLHKHSLFP